MLVQRPTRSGRPLDFGLQGLGWRSDASAASFVPTALPAPFVSLDPAPLRVLDDGSVVLLHTTKDASGATVSQAYRSTAGLVVAPKECSFTPAASCPLATLDGTDLSGKDLSGIDLTGSTMTNVNLDGTNLSGAILRSALISGSAKGAKFVGADLRNSNLHDAVLTGADLSKASLNGATVTLALFSGVTLTGALLGVKVDVKVAAPPPGMSFAGLNLTQAGFDNFSGPPLVDLHGTDWTGAVLDHATFDGLNLRGADFTNANLSSAQFGTGTDLTGAHVAGAKNPSTEFNAGVTCPDGHPIDHPEAVYPNQCRFP